MEQQENIDQTGLKKMFWPKIHSIQQHAFL